MPAAVHRRSSAWCVPDRSPREMKGDSRPTYRGERRTDVLATRDTGGIRRRADEHEVVVHDRVPPDTLSVRDEFHLRIAEVVHEDDVRITPACRVERLPRALRDHLHRNAGAALEQRQQMIEQPGILRGRRRSHEDGRIVARRRGAPSARTLPAREARGIVCVWSASFRSPRSHQQLSRRRTAAPFRSRAVAARSPRGRIRRRCHDAAGRFHPRDARLRPDHGSPSRS